MTVTAMKLGRRIERNLMSDEVSSFSRPNAMLSVSSGRFRP
jgi:hypothetical protein